MYFMPKQEMDRSLFFILPRSTAFAKKMTSFELQEQAKIELTAVDRSHLYLSRSTTFVNIKTRFVLHYSQPLGEDIVAHTYRLS